MSTRNDDTLSTKIVTLRVRHGGDIFKCPTCCKTPSDPFRRYDAHGKVIHGCIDACHGGKFAYASESSRWHYRPQAVKLRRETARSLGLVAA